MLWSFNCVDDVIFDRKYTHRTRHLIHALHAPETTKTNVLRYMLYAFVAKS